ncbi:MAG TPA: hypothetical protein PKC72_11135 [Chitinophagaceae bacterium]|nr:hypothetical protein [Chitinophagaceae bacterium]
MQRIRPDVDIVKDILEAVLEAKPASTFIQSLLFQYRERGGLSKKQLQGLYDKADKLKIIPQHKMATLEAIIRKKPTKTKSDLPEATPLYSKDEETGKKIGIILTKYPQHKRVLFFKAKYDNNEPLTSTESAELMKFFKMLA